MLADPIKEPGVFLGVGEDCQGVKLLESALVLDEALDLESQELGCKVPGVDDGDGTED